LEPSQHLLKDTGKPTLHKLNFTESLDNTLKVENTLKPLEISIPRKIFDTREINMWKLDDIT
jgi:hypothetical protein